MSKKAIVKKMELPPQGRTIVISDIHGNLDFFTNLLNQIHFSTEDTLILLGDMLEKGHHSLKTLRYIQSLQKTHQVHCLAGNYEELLIRFFKGRNAHGSFFNKFLPHNPHSLIFQMAREAGLSPQNDLLVLQKKLRETHSDVLEWLCALPTILDTPNYLFVHGGVPHLHHLEELDCWDCMKYDGFLKRDHYFEKYVVVGHTPTTLYHFSIPDSNPIVDTVHKIISIDGACVLKKDGQLNALILKENSISWEYYDGLEKVRVKESQEASVIPVNIRWGKAELKLLKKGSEFSQCRHLETNTKLSILNRYLKKDHKNRLICEDSTNYRLPVSQGEVISVSEKVKGGFLGKKDGVTGWYFGEYEEISS